MRRTPFEEIQLNCTMAPLTSIYNGLSSLKIEGQRLVILSKDWRQLIDPRSVENVLGLRPEMS